MFQKYIANFVAWHRAWRDDDGKSVHDILSTTNFELLAVVGAQRALTRRISMNDILKIEFCISIWFLAEVFGR